jgi:hypothetical protein
MSDTKDNKSTKDTKDTIGIRGFANDKGYKSYTLEQLWKDTAVPAAPERSSVD